MIVINRAIPGGTFDVVAEQRAKQFEGFFQLVTFLAEHYNEKLRLREKQDDDKIEQLDELKMLLKRLVK